MKPCLGKKLAYVHRHWDGLQTFLRDGRSWARIASLVATVKVNGVDPFAYLKATLEAVAAGHPQAKIDDLLPWNFKPAS